VDNGLLDEVFNGSTRNGNRNPSNNGGNNNNNKGGGNKNNGNSGNGNKQRSVCTIMNPTNKNVKSFQTEPIEAKAELLNVITCNRNTRCLKYLPAEVLKRGFYFTGNDSKQKS
jgi:hypothetical protein